jgi:glucose-6-phosphate 1-dehydrogenase
VRQIQITMAEHFDLSTRGALDEGVSVIRHVIDKHLSRCSRYSRWTRSAVVTTRLCATRWPLPAGVRTLRRRDVVRGRYRGYRETDGVDPASTVETYAAIRLRLDTWRWSDVPIIVGAANACPEKATEIIVELERPPRSCFPHSIRTATGCVPRASPRS